MASASLPFAPLDRRQADGLVDPEAFLRRAYHRSEVLDGWLYIDGGEFSKQIRSDKFYDYSTSILAVNLSQDFAGASAKIVSTPKPKGVPALRHGGLWVDRSKKLLFMGFAGTWSAFGDKANSSRGLWSFAPDGKGSGIWRDMKSSEFKAISRPFDGLTASGAGKGFFFGGFEGDTHPEFDVALEKPTPGMLVYDFAKNKLENLTATDASSHYVRQRGSMLYVPNFGREGILVSVGGCQRNQNTEGVDYLVANSFAQVFDIATQKWHKQSTVGAAPQPRKDYCLAGAASSNKTFEIFMYAGWGGNLGADAVGFDEVYVLSLPSFRWFKAEYSPTRPLRPRHGVSCHHVGGGQIVTVGGADTTQEGPGTLYRGVFDTPDPFKQGIGIFNLNALAFTDSHKPNNSSVYTLADDIQLFYSKNGRLPTFDSSTLSDIFGTENFTTQATVPPAGAGASRSGEGSTDAANIGAIVGGAVGGAVLLALAAVVTWFCLRRRRRNNPAATSAGAQTLSSGASDAAGRYEEVPREQGDPPEELGVSQQRSHGSPPVAEYYSGLDGRSAGREGSYLGIYDPHSAQKPSVRETHELGGGSTYSQSTHELPSHRDGDSGLPGSRQGQVHEIQGFQGGRARANGEDNYKYSMRF